MATNITPTNIATPTIPMHAAPLHHGQEASADIDLVTVAIFVVHTIVLNHHRDDYNYTMKKK